MEDDGSPECTVICEADNQYFLGNPFGKDSRHYWKRSKYALLVGLSLSIATSLFLSAVALSRSQRLRDGSLHDSLHDTILPQEVVWPHGKRNTAKSTLLLITVEYLPS